MAARASTSMLQGTNPSSSFSERKLYAIAVPSVVCLSVSLVRPTQPVEIFGNFSLAFGTFAILRHPWKISRRSFKGNPSVGGLNARGVAKYSDFFQLWNAVSPKRCKIGGKLV